MSYRFEGLETGTCELDGWFDPNDMVLPRDLTHDLVNGRARVSLFAFAITDLRILGVPVLRWSYSELLWRIAVKRGDQPAWWVVGCDLKEAVPALAARRFVKYTVRPAMVEVTAARVTSVLHRDAISFTLGDSEPFVATPEKRTLLVGRDAGWEVPWGEDDNSYADTRPVRIEEDSLAAATLRTPVAWAGSARWRGGRRHRCGVAHRWDRATKGP